MKNFRLFSIAAGTVALLHGCATTAPVVKPLASSRVESPGKTPEALQAEGDRLFSEGNYGEAMVRFEKAIELQPKNAPARFNLGLTQERQGQLAKATESYEAALRDDPGHLPSLLNLGKMYRLQDRFDAAIALYENALKSPGREYDVALLNNLSVAYRLAKKFDLAEGAARKVLSRTKDNADAYKNLALVYYDQGNYRLAEFVSANARKLDDKDPGVYNNLGMIYLKLDDRRRALAQFQKAIALNEQFAPGHLNLGALALAYRDYENAERAFAKAVALEPNSYEGQLAYAYALDGQKGRDPKKGLAAGAQFEKVLALRAGLAEAICGAGWAYAAEKSGWDKAKGYLEQCKAQPGTSPQDAQLIDAKVKGLLAMQKSGAAAAANSANAPKEKAKAGAGGSMLDKVSDAAAQQEGAESAPPAQPPASDADNAKK